MLQVLTQEKAAIKIQAGVRGLLTRRHVSRTAQEELQFIRMKPQVDFCSQAGLAMRCHLELTAFLAAAVGDDLARHRIAACSQCKAA